MLCLSAWSWSCLRPYQDVWKDVLTKLIFLSTLSNLSNSGLTWSSLVEATSAFSWYHPYISNNSLAVANGADMIKCSAHPGNVVYESLCLAYNGILQSAHRGKIGCCKKWEQKKRALMYTHTTRVRWSANQFFLATCYYIINHPSINTLQCQHSPIRACYYIARGP